MAKHRATTRRSSQAKAATVTLTAMSAAALGTVMAAPAEAACASFWGIGNTLQCQSSLGNVAVSLSNSPAVGSASATGGIGNFAFESGGSRSIVKDGVGSLAIGSGANNKTVVTGWFNKGINIGDNNTALVTGKPELDLATGSIGFGNNTVLNVGNGNVGVVGNPGPGLTPGPATNGGVSNGVYQFGDKNAGAAQGVLSNVVQKGDGNGNPLAPNVAAGLGATNLVFGNRNAQRVVGNLSLGTIKGDNNIVTNVDPKLLDPTTPLLQKFLPSANVTTVIGNNNNGPTSKSTAGVTQIGSYGLTTVVGDKNTTLSNGKGNITTVFGHSSRATAIGSPLGAPGNHNITSVFGDKSSATSIGNRQISSAIGNLKNALNGTNNLP